MFEDPNSLCLNWSFNWAFNGLSIGAASLSPTDLSDPVTELPLKSVDANYVLAALITPNLVLRMARSEAR